MTFKCTFAARFPWNFEIVHREAEKMILEEAVGAQRYIEVFLALALDQHIAAYVVEFHFNRLVIRSSFDFVFFAVKEGDSTRPNIVQYVHYSGKSSVLSSHQKPSLMSFGCSIF